MLKKLIPLLILLALLSPAALAARARSIVTQADSAYHSQHLAAHIGSETCYATGNYIKTYRDTTRKTLVGHLEQADAITLLAVTDNLAQIYVNAAGATSPDSFTGMSGWVNADYIDCTCSDNQYAANTPQDGLTIPSSWTFSSGAGGWSTQMWINPDGTFYGYYHDSDMGDTGEDYPDGTLYESNFTGRFSEIKQLDTHAYSMTVTELTVDGTPDTASISNGMRTITTLPYGIAQQDFFILYCPGTVRARLSDEQLSWLHGDISDPLTTFALCNLTQDLAFEPGDEM